MLVFWIVTFLPIGLLLLFGRKAYFDHFEFAPDTFNELIFRYRVHFLILLIFAGIFNYLLELSLTFYSGYAVGGVYSSLFLLGLYGLFVSQGIRSRAFKQLNKGNHPDWHADLFEGALDEDILRRYCILDPSSIQILSDKTFKNVSFLRSVVKSAEALEFLPEKLRRDENFVFHLDLSSEERKKVDTKISDLFKTAETNIEEEKRSEDYLYEKALTEVEENNQVPALWARSLAECDGDELKAKSKYIKFRVKQLRKK